MILKPGETYKIEFKFGSAGDRVQLLHIQEITRHCYMQGGTMVGTDFEIKTPSLESYLVPEYNVGMYQKAHPSTNLMDWIVLEHQDCGLFSFLGHGGCNHNWADTGLSWTYCKSCNQEGWTSMGVTGVR